jgi:TonB family protein
MNANAKGAKGQLLLLLLGLVCLAASAQQSATSGNTDASAQPITDQDTSKMPLKTDDRVAPCPAEFTMRSLPDGIYRVGGDVLEPMPTKTAEATLSNEAREFIKEHHVKQFEAISLVGVTVDTNGMPQNICVLKKAGHGLDREALGVAAKYRFKPATLHGKPVPVRVTIGVRFANFPSNPSYAGGQG